MGLKASEQKSTENRNKGETRLEGGERFASFDDRGPIKLIVALGVESAEG